MGLEPTYNGFAIRSIANSATVPKMAKVEGFEPPTYAVGKGTQSRTEISGVGSLYSTIELHQYFCPHKYLFANDN